MNRVSLTSWGRAIRLDGWSPLHPLVVLRCVAGIRKERIVWSQKLFGGRIQRLITHLWSLITKVPLYEVRFKLQAMWPCEIMHIMICFWLSICLGLTIKWDHITYAHYLCPPGSSKTSKWRWSKSRQTVVVGRKKQLCKAFGIDIVQLRIDRDSSCNWFLHAFFLPPWQTPMKSNKYPFGFHGNFYHRFPVISLPNFTHENPCKSAWRIWRSPNNSPWYLLWRQNTSPGIAGIAEFWKTLNIAE